MSTLRGKVALITGGSRGIGLATAHALVRAGARVCLTGRTEPSLREAVAALGGPDTAMAVVGRVDDEGHQDETVARVVDAFGRIDVLVNNAAVNPKWGPVLDLPGRTLSKILDVNLLAPLSWTRKVWAAWLSAHGGAVVNVGSVAALRATPGVGFYGVSKAALVRLTVELAAELAPRVRVNAVLPGVVRTAMSASALDGQEAELAKAYPLARLGTVEEVAAAIAFLAGPGSEWTTGSSLVVDGGVTLGGVL